MKKSFFRKGCALFLALSLFFFSVPAAAAAPEWPAAPAIDSEAAVLLDADTGNLLYAKNKDDRKFPASTTKILTALLVLRDMTEDTLTLSAQAAAETTPDSSSIYALEGEIFSREEALHAILLASANEVSYAAGEACAGSLKRFVERMNAAARGLGCENTHFNNANGLPDARHYTTAHDLGRIARAAWRNETFRKICGTAEYTIPVTNKTAEPRTLVNHHRMLLDGENRYDGCLGGKTGYTSAAGNTLVTYANRNGVTLICVLLKNDAGTVYGDTRTLFDYGFENFEPLRIPAQKTRLSDLFSPIAASFPASRRLTLFFNYQDSRCLVPKGVTERELSFRTVLRPNAAGRSRLQRDYYYKKHKVGTTPLYPTGNLRRLFQDF